MKTVSGATADAEEDDGESYVGRKILRFWDDEGADDDAGEVHVVGKKPKGPGQGGKPSNQGWTPREVADIFRTSLSGRTSFRWVVFAIFDRPGWGESNYNVFSEVFQDFGRT